MNSWIEHARRIAATMRQHWRLYSLLWLVGVLGMLALGRHLERRHTMPGLVRNPPWLMWGNSITQDVTFPGGGGPATVSTSQLIRIAYARPEAWRFMLSAQILDCSVPSDASTLIVVDFDLTTGVGRSQIVIKKFERYVMKGAIVGDFMLSTSVLGPIRDENLPVNPAVQALNVIDLIPGQDIQLQARIQVSANPATVQKATVRVDAYFTPNVHIRPEWFKGKMGQEEDQGR